ncbi:hypothetical protein JVT61DRAFT_5690 [Boletus reticuloceps]|uniref:FAM192A/Fyv6 N-terminal domain-containing protein n=1 Tax=Boletus reticuloceps TaxID=495285 RepID=A0A8I2Z020_9AGAM|nr:hypothetical protein JVT61DRAFT_5690 [Boletus reticuloceps]
MEEGLPTVAVTGVASRFVSQTDIEAARTRREEQWRAAYARSVRTIHTTLARVRSSVFRLGQEPPPQPTEDAFDGRSLAEVSCLPSWPTAVLTLTTTETGCEQGKILANTQWWLMDTWQAAKQEEWEEKTKLANQFRALEEDEIMFLDSIREKQAEEERLRKLQDGEELSDFRKAVAARESAINNPPPVVSKPPAPSKPGGDDQTKVTLPPPKKEVSVKQALKGVIVKRKPKATGQPSLAPSPTSTSAAKDSGDPPSKAKRRKITSV